MSSSIQMDHLHSLCSQRTVLSVSHSDLHSPLRGYRLQLGAGSECAGRPLLLGPVRESPEGLSSPSWLQAHSSGFSTLTLRSELHFYTCNSFQN